MKQNVLIGQTDYTVLVFIPDPASTDGSGKTGLVAANLTAGYTRVETDNDVVDTDGTSSLNNLASLTAAHADWGWLEVNSTTKPGWYRLDLPDGVFAAGAWSAGVNVMITTSAAAATPMEFVLTANNPWTGVLPANAITRASLAADTGLQPIRSNTAQAGGASTITLDTGASSVDDFYNGASILLTGGTGAGQFDIITDYVGSTRVATVSTTWATNPDSSTTFAMFPAAASTAELAAAVWDMLTSGHTTAGTFGAQLKTELEARTLTAALILKLSAHVSGMAIGAVAASGSSTTAVAFNTTTGIDGGVPSATNDAYKDRVIIFTSGAMILQAAAITAYNGTTKIATVTTMTGTPASGVSFILV